MLISRDLANLSGGELLIAALLVASVFALRYVLFAGGALLLLQVFKKPLAARRIQPVPIKAAQTLRELAYSISTIFVFSLTIIAALLVHKQIGIFQIYRDPMQYGALWLILSLPVLIVLHDFYFYWAHRFMHLPGVFELVHKVHHRSTNPTPLAAFAFHPIEAFIEILGVLIILMIVPLWTWTVVVFGLYSLATNVMGHLGYELLPRVLVKNRWLSWINTATSHNQHHRTYTYNYGLYSLVWDRLFSTLHPGYRKLYERTTEPPVSSRPVSTQTTANLGD
jgi:Delta7-sterol 5-desaturase